MVILGWFLRHSGISRMNELGAFPAYEPLPQSQNQFRQEELNAKQSETSQLTYAWFPHDGRWHWYSCV